MPVPYVDDSPYTGSAIHVRDVEIKPVPLKQVRPKYPKDFRRYRINGEAVIEFEVDVDGNPQNLMTRKATDRAFAEAAMVSISQWEFSPAQNDGQTVRCRMQIPIIFTINDD